MIDYNVLGDTVKTRERRFKVIQLQHKGLNQSEIARMMEVNPAQITRDLKHIRKLYADGEETPIKILQAEGASFFNMKIREYEGVAGKAKKNGMYNIWLGCQNKIIDLKIKELTMYGAFAERLIIDENITVKEAVSTIEMGLIETGLVKNPEEARKLADWISDQGKTTGKK